MAPVNTLKTLSKGQQSVRKSSKGGAINRQTTWLSADTWSTPHSHSTTAANVEGALATQ